MSYRLARLENQIKDELSLILLYKLSDPALGFITITGVKLSPDAKLAKVYISVYEKGLRDESLERIEKASGVIRSQLAAKIRVRYVPELKFYIDDTSDNVERIENLLKQIHKDDKQTDDNEQ